VPHRAGAEPAHLKPCSHPPPGLRALPLSAIFFAMISDIRKHLDTIPFVPFALRTANGREYPVPTYDHIYLPPGGGRVVVSDDDGIIVVLSSLLISGLVQGSRARKHKPRR